jgi:hypothetical protein
VRSSERLQLIIRMGRPPLEISYGAGPIGSITVAQKLRAPQSLPEAIIQQLELIRENDFKSHDSRIRAVIGQIFISCPEFETVGISYPGGVVWESRPMELPSAAA